MFLDDDAVRKYRIAEHLLRAADARRQAEEALDRGDFVEYSSQRQLARLEESVAHDSASP